MELGLESGSEKYGIDTAGDLGLNVEELAIHEHSLEFEQANEFIKELEKRRADNLNAIKQKYCREIKKDYEENKAVLDYEVMKSHLEKIHTFAKQLKIILRNKDYLISRIKKAQERQNYIEIPNRYHKDFMSLVHTLWYIVSNSTEFVEAHEFLRCYKVDFEQEASDEESRVLRAGRIDRLYHIIEQIEKTISEKKDINADADIRQDASVQLVRLSEELRDAVQNIQG